MVLATVSVAAGFALLRFRDLATYFDRTPGFPSASSRSQLAVDALRLVGDFPFTGGGLNAFPGLYSEYLRVIPHYLFGYSHNLYLDVSIEQGLAGLAALLAVLWLSLRSSFRAGAARPVGLRLPSDRRFLPD